MRLARHKAKLAIFLGLALVVAACGGTTDEPTTDTTVDGAGSATTTVDSAPAERVEITFSYLWGGSEGEALEVIITEFNESQDAITVIGVSSPDFQAQLASMSSSNGSFDISDHFGNGVASWAETGILASLDEFIEADGYDLSDFVPAALDQMRYEGELYSMPIAVHTQMMLYNKTLFAEAGIDGPPTTTEEWAENIAALTKVDDAGEITQLGYAHAEIGTSMTTLGFVFGGNWYGDDGTPTPSDAGNIEAAQWYVDNVPGAVGVDEMLRFTSGFGEYASSQNPFYTGQVATVIDGGWQTVMTQEFAPGLDWGVAPLPYPADRSELAGATQVTASTLFIPENSQKKAEAWEFMKFLLGKSQMADFTRALANLPARISLLGNPIYDDLPSLDVWLNGLASENARSLDSSVVGAEYTADLRLAFDDIVQLRSTPAEAFQEVEARISSYGSP